MAYWKTLRKLQASLGGAEKNKMDEYLSSVREIETRIQTVERNAASAPVNVDFPAPSAGVKADFGEHARLMTDPLVLAFQTDMTRIATVLFSIEQSPRAYVAEIGLPEGHHGLTHHNGDREKTEKVTQINWYHMKSLVYAPDRLKSVKEGNGTLKPGRHIRYAPETPMANRFDGLNKQPSISPQ